MKDDVLGEVTEYEYHPPLLTENDQLKCIIQQLARTKHLKLDVYYFHIPYIRSFKEGGMERVAKRNDKIAVK